MQRESYVGQARARRYRSDLPASVLGLPFTKRQREVCELVMQGQTLKQAGRELGISNRTVEVYLNQAYEKCGVKDLNGLFRALVQRGWTCPCCGRAAA